MGRAILLTGSPGCGKTTLIERVVSRLESPAGGFLTREVREAGRRVGFELLTLDGRRDWLAHVNLTGTARVGKYRVNLRALEELAAGTVRAATREGKIVVIDEIGPMELLSSHFCHAVVEALAGPSLVLATIMRRSHPFADRVKAHPTATLLEVTRDNREVLLGEILRLVGQGIERSERCGLGRSSGGSGGGETADCDASL